MAKATSKKKSPKRKSGDKKGINSQELLGYYKEMLLIRRFEEKAGQLYGMGQSEFFLPQFMALSIVVVNTFDLISSLFMDIP